MITSFIKGSAGVVSLIGAGGKTTLMFRLAKAFSDSGKKVLTTTTTKIFFPPKDLSPETVLVESVEALADTAARLLEKSPHFCAGSRYDLSSGKLDGLSPQFIDSVRQANIFDWIIVEADGSRQKPLKATAPHEPVIPGSTTCLILVAGLDSIGLPLNDHHVHRSAIFSDNTGLAPESLVDETALAASIALELKKASGFCAASEHLVFLNKADTPERVASAKNIAALLKDKPHIDQIIIAALKDDHCIKETIGIHR